jgi:hypothetical protein
MANGAAEPEIRDVILFEQVGIHLTQGGRLFRHCESGSTWTTGLLTQVRHGNGDTARKSKKSAHEVTKSALHSAFHSR